MFCLWLIWLLEFASCSTSHPRMMPTRHTLSLPLLLPTATGIWSKQFDLVTIAHSSTTTLLVKSCSTIRSLRSSPAVKIIIAIIIATKSRWQTLHSMAMYMHRHSCLGLEFMAFATQANNYILNRDWSESWHCIPFVKLINVSVINLSHVCVFSCHCYVEIDPSRRKKIWEANSQGHMYWP